ncbi:MAG: hypothetical protein CTY10_08295 [Methylotenera sp.]|nr:MAG: hypothetical protein CTY10_08295 [Methylotenera sp.]
MKFVNILFGIALLGFSAISSAVTCNDAVRVQQNKVTIYDFTDVNNQTFINPSPLVTCQSLDNVAPQNAQDIGNYIEQVFALDFDLNLLQQANITTQNEGQGSDLFTISGLAAFNYLALHYGSNELFFQFSTPITGFTLTNLTNGLSNYRTYTGGVNAVPLPAAGWLFSSALIGLMGLRRKMH